MPKVVPLYVKVMEVERDVCLMVVVYVQRVFMEERLFVLLTGVENVVLCRGARKVLEGGPTFV